MRSSEIRNPAKSTSFSANRNFGLLPEQVFFFTQKELPMLDQEGNLFLENPQSIALGPDGNGYSLRYFYESGIWETTTR